MLKISPITSHDGLSPGFPSPLTSFLLIPYHLWPLVTALARVLQEAPLINFHFSTSG